MNLKAKLGSGIIAGVLGLSLIGGGTYAYFSDQVTTHNTFAAGTLDLSVEPEVVVEVENMKPGDSIIRDFELQNNGTLNIQTVSLDTNYTVIDAAGDNTEDFGEHIQVSFLYNANQMNEVVYETTLAKLKDMKPEAITDKVFDEVLKNGGLEVGESHDLVVVFEFVDNGEDQNEFQGDQLELEWTFIAEQTAGEDL